MTVGSALFSQENSCFLVGFCDSYSAQGWVYCVCRRKGVEADDAVSGKNGHTREQEIFLHLR